MAKKSLVMKWMRIQGGDVKFSTRRYNRCRICGRPRGYMRDFEMCRICFRDLASFGKIPGIQKSSW